MHPLPGLAQPYWAQSKGLEDWRARKDQGKGKACYQNLGGRSWRIGGAMKIVLIRKIKKTSSLKPTRRAREKAFLPGRQAQILSWDLVLALPESGRCDLEQVPVCL